jgi:hypothetical protein
MSITTELTVQKLTPPGYFDLSEVAASKHRDYISWFQQQLSWRSDQAAALSNLILTPWLVDFADSPRAPWLNYLLSSYGFGFFGGTNNQAAALYKLISGSWELSTIANIKKILDALCFPPFSWFDVDFIPRVYSGMLVSSITDTGYLIYTTASSPSTPANTPYSNREWTAPTGWTRAPASAVKYCRGYVSGSSIVWCVPRPTSDFANATYFSASIPLSVPSAGTVCIVDDDGTGDRRAVYYSDGSAWRKNSQTNVNLGLVVPEEDRPVPEATTVWAPNPTSVTYAISSSLPPPSTGPSKGYGTFAGWSDTSITNNELTVRVRQIAGGNVAISTVLSVLRRIKPLSFVLKVEIDDVKYTINDARMAP